MQSETNRTQFHRKGRKEREDRSQTPSALTFEIFAPFAVKQYPG